MKLTIEIQGPSASDEALELAAALTSVEGVRIDTPPAPSKLDIPSAMLLISFSNLSVGLVAMGLAVWNRIDQIRKPPFTYSIKLPNGHSVTVEGPEARRLLEQTLKNYEESQNRD
jgi:hypothetical protein